MQWHRHETKQTYKSTTKVKRLEEMLTKAEFDLLKVQKKQ